MNSSTLSHAPRRRWAATSSDLFHLAVPPNALLGIIEMLGATGLNVNTKIICEKPFGTDLASARQLNATIAECFDEAHVFRIDHFLGKESIDNILALRFANGLFEPIWNRTYVSYVQIDVPETLSIEGRGAFFEQTGTFRDMVVTHLFQVLAFVAMEQPISLDAKPLRDEIAKVFDSIAPINPEHVIRGQYDGYLNEAGVAPDSQIETFVALRADVENPRWKGVPFFLRTGKSMAQSRQVVTIGFKEPVMRMFPVDHMEGQRHGNELVADFADPGSIQTHFLAKQPGPQMRLAPAVMNFRYADSFQTANNLEAYEHLILEAMLGNQALLHAFRRDRAPVGDRRRRCWRTRRRSNCTSRDRGDRSPSTASSHRTGGPCLDELQDSVAALRRRRHTRAPRQDTHRASLRRCSTCATPASSSRSRAVAPREDSTCTSSRHN